MPQTLRGPAIVGLLLSVVLLLGACTTGAGGLAPGGTITPFPFPTQPATVEAGPAQQLVAQWEANAKLGDILTNAQGMTLYTYQNDKPDTSNCTGACATTWPPETIPQGWQPVAAPEVPGKVGVIQRSDGTPQVTYNQMPLYLYSGDKNPGDANGQGVNNLWSAVKITPVAMPTSAPAAATPAVTPTP